MVVLVYSPAATTFYVFAAPPAGGFLNSESCYVPDDLKTGGKVSCCWGDKVTICQTCKWTEGVGYSDCNTPSIMPVLEQPPTPPSSGPAAPLQDGVLEQPPSQGVAPPLTRGQGVLPQNGVLQQQPTDQGAAPRTVEPPAEDEAAQSPPEPLTDCPEGQILDEETGLCVLEETEVVEEPESGEELEEQPTEEADSSEENRNN